MSGDRRERFEAIYTAYSGLIFAYAVRRTSSVDDAADVVAETFTVAWRRLGDVPEGDEARPWLYGVARRVLANHRRGVERRRRLDERLLLELAAACAGSPSVGEGPELEGIAAALARLGDADRELLTLVGWEGLGREEIAVVLGCSREAVRVRLHRARRRFGRRLDEVGVKRFRARGHGSVRGASTLCDLEET